MELFIAKEEAQAQYSLLKTILDQLDNGILIAGKLSDIKFLAKYANNKLNLLFGTDLTDLNDSMQRNEENQKCLDSRAFTAVKDKKKRKKNQASSL